MSGTAADGTEIPIVSSLRLFLSIDIVGSTRFKQRPPHMEHDSVTDWWVAPFLSFYRQSVDGVAEVWKRKTSAAAKLRPALPLGSAPEYWKGAGDEVLFTKVVRSPQDAVLAIGTMIEVMERHRVQFRKAPHTERLNVKGTAWLAGFPINNVAIPIEHQPSEAIEEIDDPVTRNFRLLANGATSSAAAYDFIGPSIDLGFRLREKSTPRRLMVSADLAWLLACAEELVSKAHRAECQDLALPGWGYGGQQSLRGIMDEDPYPIIWLRSEDDSLLDVAEQRLRRESHRIRTDAVKGFCALFLNGESAIQTRPYISDCDIESLRTMSAAHQERLRALARYVNGSTIQVSTVAATDSRTGEIPDAARNFGRKAVDALARKPAPPRGKRPAPDGKR